MTTAGAWATTIGLALVMLAIPKSAYRFALVCAALLALLVLVIV